MKGYLSLNDASQQRIAMWVTDESRGQAEFKDERGIRRAVLGVDEDGGFLDLYGPEDMFVAKRFDGVGSAFVMPHPEDPGQEIRYFILEGPEVGVYLRGSAALHTGRAEVTLPDHFAHVASPDDLTVQLTPRSRESRGVAATRLTCRHLVIEELGGGEGHYAVDYLIHGVRKDRVGVPTIRNRRRRPASPEDPAAELLGSDSEGR